MGLGYKCKFVQNLTGNGKNAKALYKVSVNAGISRSLHETFGTSFSADQDTCLVGRVPI